MAGSYDIPLHDIKPLMELPESSSSISFVLAVVMAILLFGGLYLLYRFMQSRKSVDYRKIHYKALAKVDFSDPKKAAYAITDHGRIFADDSPRLHEAYENLRLRLEMYKYKKVVTAIDDESRRYYKIYLKMINI